MFTEAEVERFYQSIVIKKPELSTSLTVDDLRFWYKGYEAHSGVKLYNPVSVSRALFYRRVNEYWTTTGMWPLQWSRLTMRYFFQAVRLSSRASLRRLPSGLGVTW
ncbi:uncharacterized protein STEHIDRAFT_128134 [Stereum hirsutum FP-91666 SS1]|uniref:uncharacterized protein n=1 Tax=Stereum hirsutum (strain FP-91666) TaxID=721885 RepID=UPI00044104B9|nr:uncharacterized protein STEHIDRAFT_128134 [Stereum hirsutum FP-91666 SS1]EIM91179.1 hypothetical protein STEHIDRAFT_128134 [Stereum hirsutum FP-91666 SS1]